MGSPSSEAGRRDNETQHEVRLTGDFEIQSTKVTQSQFVELMGYNPSHFTACGDNCPVETVNWYEAAAYCNELSEIAGLDRCYDCSGSGRSVECEPSGSYSTPYDCPGYRLPTESEWEYAARAGTSDSRYGDLDDVAWHRGNSEGDTHEVGALDPNDWGLNDMLGNVWEWCHDWYDDYPSGLSTDPWGPAAGSARVRRGGSWDNTAGYTRAAGRLGDTPASRNRHQGFRPSRSL